MKFANIDDAILEASKKQKPAAPEPTPDAKAKDSPSAPKTTKPKKKVAEPAPAVPAAPKKAAKPAAPKKTAVPKKEKKVVEPAPASTPTPEPEKKEEEPKKEPEQKPAETKPTQSTDSGERRKFAPRWLQSKPRGIGDRLKTAWKGFTAKAGDKIDVPHKYKSVFHEIQKLMEQLQLVESMLREQSLNESYDAGTVNNLYEHRNAIRSVLVEQIVREELYKHNVTIAELDQHQRGALMETVNIRANALWEGLNQMEESSHETKRKINMAMLRAASKSPETMAQIKKDAEAKYGNTLLRSQRAAMKHIMRNAPEGVPRYMEESYTLEEWMGMMEEAGYNLNELSPELLSRYSNKVGDTLTQARDDYDAKRVGDAEINARLDKRIKGMGMAQQSIEKRAQTPQGLNAIEKAKDQDKTASAQQSFDKGLDKAANAEMSIRAAQQAKREREKMGLKFEDSYTLEEWMGMMEEAGYSLEEGETKKINKEKKNTAIAAIGKDTTEVDPEDGYYDPHDDSDSVGHLTTGRNATNPSRRAFGTRIFMKRGGDVKRPKLSDTSPTKKPEQGSKHAELRDRVRQRRKKATFNENTVARLQNLAGIKPTE